MLTIQTMLISRLWIFMRYHILSEQKQKGRTWTVLFTKFFNQFSTLDVSYFYAFLRHSLA